VIDSHAHLHDRQFDRDRAETVARARSAGITTIVNVGCDLHDSERALETARAFGDYASVGIHPHEAKDAPGDVAAAFDPFLRDERVVAIGETGLDYYYDRSPREAQQRVMRAQVRLARERGSALIFHHRDAYDDFLAILREEWSSGMRGVVHCFTGTPQQASTYVGEFGLRLGIGGVLTFKTAEQVREAVRAVGLEPLLLETDCPYLAPVPHRGKRNEPAYVTSVAEALSGLLGVGLDEIEDVTSRNARSLFNLPPQGRT
jgi:TatD DNase family protein